MRILAPILLLTALAFDAVAQPADCRTEPSSGPVLPLALSLSGRNNVPSGTSGTAFVDVPMPPPGMACHDAPTPPSDALHGEQGDLLHGPGTPHVTVEVQ